MRVRRLEVLPVFFPPFFLMDGIVLAKGLGRPSRTFFERGSAASERACENKFLMGQRLGIQFGARKKGGLMGSGADAERRKGLGASPQARPRDEGALVGRDWPRPAFPPPSLCPL